MLTAVADFSATQELDAALITMRAFYNMIYPTKSEWIGLKLSAAAAVSVPTVYMNIGGLPGLVAFPSVLLQRADTSWDTLAAATGISSPGEFPFKLDSDLYSLNPITMDRVFAIRDFNNAVAKALTPAPTTTTPGTTTPGATPGTTPGTSAPTSDTWLKVFMVLGALAVSGTVVWVFTRNKQPLRV